MIRCYTLVDITPTGFTARPKTPSQIATRNQQRNYETFIQLISLRSQPEIIHKPIYEDKIEIDKFHFGSYYMPSVFPYNLWWFDFDSEHVDSFFLNNNPVGSLIQDFDNVPVVGGLDETAKIQGVISTSGETLNTYFESF